MFTWDGFAATHGDEQVCQALYDKGELATKSMRRHRNECMAFSNLEELIIVRPIIMHVIHLCLLLCVTTLNFNVNGSL